MTQALTASEMARQHSISQDSLVELNHSQRELIRRTSAENDLVLYTLPGGNICVPTLLQESGDSQYIHVMKGKVSFRG